MPANIQYTRDGFRQVARRRIQEARSLLDVEPRKPKRPCDGATTCALLAAECALKAALLHGDDEDTTEAVIQKDPDKYKAAFKTAKGHDLVQLWSLQGNKTSPLKTPELGEAINKLHSFGRYEHRYGAKRPQRANAAEAVEAAEEIVAWMERTVI